MQADVASGATATSDRSDTMHGKEEDPTFDEALIEVGSSRLSNTHTQRNVSSATSNAEWMLKLPSSACDPDIPPWTYCPRYIPPDITTGQFPLLLHGVGHFPLPSPPSADLKYKRSYLQRVQN